MLPHPGLGYSSTVAFFLDSIKFGLCRLLDERAVAYKDVIFLDSFLVADRGETALRGFEDPVRLYEVRWREEG